MRAAMLLAVGCLFCLSQTGLASPRELVVVKLSRPNTEHSVFVEDRNACLWAANREPWAGRGDAGAWARHHMTVFGECMGAKGYKSDPNGFNAIRYSQDEGRHRIFVEAL